MTQEKITVIGAREHNLKNIDVEIPRDKLVVISGISGSGKKVLWVGVGIGLNEGGQV